MPGEEVTRFYRGLSLYEIHITVWLFSTLIWILKWQKRVYRVLDCRGFYIHSLIFKLWVCIFIMQYTSGIVKCFRMASGLFVGGVHYGPSPFFHCHIGEWGGKEGIICIMLIYTSVGCTGRVNAEALCTNKLYIVLDLFNDLHLNLLLITNSFAAHALNQTVGILLWFFIKPWRQSCFVLVLGLKSSNELNLSIRLNHHKWKLILLRLVIRQ